MKTEEMTPAWVVENFLPDFQERYRDYYEVDIDNDLSPDYELEYPYWIDKRFPEALSELLKEQRWICADVADYHLESNPILQDYPVINVNEIRDAHIPEPKNRK